MMRILGILEPGKLDNVPHPYGSGQRELAAAVHDDPGVRTCVSPALLGKPVIEAKMPGSGEVRSCA